MKTLKYLMLMCLVLYSGNLVKAQSHWTCDESNFEYDMSAFITIEDNGAIVSNLAAFEVGAFVENECRGVSKVEWNDDGTPYLYLRIRSNVASGEKVFFKYYNKRTGAEDAFGTTLVFENRASKGFPSNPLILSTDNNRVIVDANTIEGGYTEGSGTYTVGSKVTVNAVAEEGWHFVQWSDGTTTPEFSFTVTENVNLKAEFARNIYKITFLSYDGNTIIQQKELPFEDVIDIPEAPEREGYTFATWGDVPSNVPSNDLTFTAQYTINQYTVKFIADDKVVYEQKQDYGSEIIVPEAPDKEGHTFVTWGDVPKTVPAGDVIITAQYSVNQYHITFMAQGKIIYDGDLDYGTPITAPDAPAKTGYTFNTWGDVPQTMPANDLMFTAQYRVNKYKVTFIADGTTVFDEMMPYGSEIIVPDAPEKEGHTFVTWGDVPTTVPDNDITFTAKYKVNQYHISFIAEGKTISEADIDYGSDIIIPEAPAKTGYTFSTWGNVPKTMPAKDISFTATYTINKYLVKFIADEKVVFEKYIEYGAEIPVPEAPAKEGYTFKTWGDIPATVPLHDVTFTAEYTINSYLVKFVAEDKVVFEKSMEYGSKITVPEAPAKEGHTFKTWGDVPATVPAHDVTFTAQYSVNKYHLSFVANSVTVFEGDVDYGSKINIPKAPDKEGYTFNTWGNVPETMPAKDLAFTAKYDINKYLVKFVADDKVIYEKQQDYGSKITVPEAPAKEGYTFKTWGKVPATVPAHDVIFTAQYLINKYHISFVANGKTVYEADLDYGSKITVPEAPKKEGHTFVTWGDVPATMPAKDLAFTAKYDTNSYNVKFIADGKVIYEKVQKFGSKITVPDAPQKEGYTFKTWGNVPATVPAHDVTFTAEYIINKYHLSFVANGKTVYEGDLDYGSKINVPKAPVKEGYTFVTWGDVPETMPAKDLAFTAKYDTNSYNVKFIADGKVVYEKVQKFGSKITVPDAPQKEGYTFKTWGNVPATVPAHDVTFTAEYIVNSYHISFVANGETIYEADINFGSNIKIPEAPVKEGYTFSSWGDVPATMPSHDLAFNARYTINYYTVKFVADNKVVYEQSQKYGSKINIPNAPSKEGYTFSSWGNVPTTVPAHDVTFYAQYTINKYRLQFVADGVTVSDEMIEYGAAITNIPEAPVKKGYKFVTWGDIPATMPAHDLKFDAQYEENDLLIGDVNNDGRIDVSDISGIVSIILSEQAGDLKIEAADINFDGNIDVSDIASLVKIIMSDSATPAPMYSGVNNGIQNDNALNIEILPFAIQAGEEKTIEVIMNNYGDAFCAFQFDLYLPEGISIKTDDDGSYEVYTGSRTNSSRHSIECAKRADGSIRILVYSLSNSNFNGEDGDVLSLNLCGSSELTDIITEGEIRNVVMSRADASSNLSEGGAFSIISKESDGITNSISGMPVMDEVTFPADIYTINGKLVKKDADARDFRLLPNGMYIINGKKISKKYDTVIK